MAEVSHQDVKVLLFASKNLPPHDYERVFTAEPCVAVLSGKTPTHRHAILGHRKLYMTEFPPRHLRVVFRLNDVQSVQMVGS